MKKWIWCFCELVNVFGNRTVPGTVLRLRSLDLERAARPSSGRILNEWYTSDGRLLLWIRTDFFWFGYGILKVAIASSHRLRTGWALHIKGRANQLEIPVLWLVPLRRTATASHTGDFLGIDLLEWKTEKVAGPFIATTPFSAVSRLLREAAAQRE